MKPAPRHDAVRKQYEAEAAHNRKAYELWERRVSRHYGVWRDCVQTPAWYEHMEYRRKSRGHKHVELMLQYAEDAATHEKPWELWESQDTLLGEAKFGQMTHPISWLPHIDYRRKPKKHIIVLTTDQLREVILACEHPGWENDDFTSAVLALRIALREK